MSRRYVIIGGGAAGSQAALEIRKRDRTGRITLVGREPYPVYYKYAMMDYLCGAVPKEALFHEDAGRFVKQDIHLRLSQEVVGIVPREKIVRLAHRETLPYDRLLITTGVSACVHPSYKPFSEHLTLVNSLEDVKKLLHRKKTLERPLVLGGSLTAIRLAAALRTMDRPVDYLLFKKMTGNLLAGADDFGRVYDLLVASGVRVFQGIDVKDVTQKTEGFGVVFTDGRRETYTRIFAGFGVAPNVEPARKAGIACDQGILVDEYFETDHPGIFAAGDVAQVYNPKLKDYWVNFGWPNAVKQGLLAGRNMSGERKAYQPSRVNVLALGGKKITFRDWQ